MLNLEVRYGTRQLRGEDKNNRTNHSFAKLFNFNPTVKRAGFPKFTGTGLESKSKRFSREEYDRQEKWYDENKENEETVLYPENLFLLNFCEFWANETMTLEQMFKYQNIHYIIPEAAAEYAHKTVQYGAWAK